jgi:hypothetical protein
MMPSLPPLNLSSSATSTSGNVSAPNTVNFGGFGSGSGGSGMGSISQYLPLIAVGALVLILARKH